ncbi:sensor histidine kinase [Reichenbachiella sp.]|uniref:sensor histidine kinase n=1 Tax=Reichenbachiella sp. TaxID=2184521 RepID=UPI003BB189B4
MKFRWRLILYFGFAGVVASVVLTLLRMIESDFAFDFFTICGNFLLNALSAYVLTVLVSVVVMHTLIKINRVFPWRKNAVARFCADVIITPLVAMLTMLPLAYLTYYIGLDYVYPDLKKHITNELMTALVVDLILVGIYEGYFFFTLWRKSLIRNEQLEKENMTARYEALKNQINPHFLFNSLNTASALIHEDPNRAEEFIDEFSKIYRFLLEHQGKNLHLLKDELTFVRSFLSLQEIRFGKNLRSTIEVEEYKLKHLIPTLSLQLLVENAIKHNQVTAEKPLSIIIKDEDDMIVVKNTLQPRSESLKSTGIGLNNLNARYEMLASLKPVFLETGKEYVAKLPLIKEE